VEAYRQKEIKMTYVEALNKALHDILTGDSDSFLIGQGVQSPWYVGGACDGLLDRFGPERVIDTPVSENAMMGAAVGAAITGMKPIIVFPRMDFMLYAMDPIVNQASKHCYTFGGQAGPCPVTIWAIINRGGGQGTQHSSDYTHLFAGIPGLKVVTPNLPEQVYNLFKQAVADPNPVLFVDNRAWYNDELRCPAAHVNLEDCLIRMPCTPKCHVPVSPQLEEEYWRCQEKRENVWIPNRCR